MAGLSLRHICKVYEGREKKPLFRKRNSETAIRVGDFTAVNDFNMEIDDGEFIVFVGPSGCGKSTTLRMIAGLEEITSGELYIGDKLVNNIEPKDRDIAMVFQSYALFPHMTAYENIAFGLKMRKVPTKVLTPAAKEKWDALEAERKLRVKEYKQLTNSVKNLEKQHKRAVKGGEIDNTELERQIAETKAAAEAKQAEIKAAETKLDETVKSSEPVLRIDNRKLRSLKSDLREAMLDLKCCENDEETANVNEHIAKIKEEIAYFETTPVEAYDMKRLPRRTVNDKVSRAAKILEIEELLDSKPRAMSGGQRQRIALGRAIVREPKVMLLDEPLSNLDAKLRASMRAEIVKLHNELKTTFIYVTHDQIEAMTMGTRIVVMKKGIVQQIDTPVNLFDYPANKFVAGFIGTPQMNFFDVTIKKVGEKLDVRFVNGDVQSFALSALRKIDDGYLDGKEHEVVLGVRGENIAVSDSGIGAKLVLKEILGNTTQMFVKVSPDSPDTIVCASERNDLKVGDGVKITMQGKHIHLFDRDSERSIMSGK